MTDFFREPKDKKSFFVCITLFLITVFIAAKAGYNASNLNAGIDFWDASLKSVVIYRLDSVFIGVLAGWLLYRWPLFFRRLKGILALAGIFGIVFLFIGIGYFRLTIENHPSFWNIAYLPLTSTIICCFLPLSYEWNPDLPLLKDAATFGSKITYAFYMLNCGIIVQLLRGYFSGNCSGLFQVTIVIGLYYLTLLLLSAVVYKYYQRIFSK